MKKIIKPSKIELTDEEEKLLVQINFDPSHYSADFEEILRSSCVAAATLTELLLSRQAIPEIRSRYFTDPKLNIGTKNSRKQVFEQNGTRGRAIIEHPHFLKYLQYFVFGPHLPEAVIDEFVNQASGFYVELGDLCKLSRYSTRQYKLDPHKACEEFYKLALECDLPEYEARMVRDDVKKVKNPKIV